MDYAYAGRLARVAGMARRTFMRVFSAQAGMSFGRWREQARSFADLEMAQRKSVTEVAIAVGYDSVSAFIEMFRTIPGTPPQTYFRDGAFASTRWSHRRHRVPFLTLSRYQPLARLITSWPWVESS